MYMREKRAEYSPTVFPVGYYLESKNLCAHKPATKTRPSPKKSSYTHYKNRKLRRIGLKAVMPM